VLRIRPEWTAHEVYLWANLLIGPAVFHTDHVELILERLGTTSLPDEYLAKLERRLTDDALRALGLPTCTIAAKNNPAPPPSSRNTDKRDEP
jgi:hypothetical protein